MFLEGLGIAGEPKNLLEDTREKSTTGSGEARTRISQPPPPARPASHVGSEPGRGATTGGRGASTGAGASRHVRAQVGDVIDTKYRVLEVIGQGGMGQVLAATHLELQQEVALKFMSPAIMEIPGAVARFTREARAAAKLRSEHVCRVLDIGETEEGAKYIVIEHLDGSDLAQRIREDGPMSAEDAARYISEACDALGEAHALDIVHRDIKPANLFLHRGRDGKGMIKVLDFGISKSLGNSPDMIVTATNALMGSPLYMSPEQLLAPKTVDTRADIWSLGIVLHELLVGAPPFQAETLPEVIALIVNERRPPVASISNEIPEGLRAVIEKCLQRDPVRRYRTAEQLAEALLAAVAGEEPPKRRAVPAPAERREGEERTTLGLRIVLGIALVAALAAGAFFLLRSSSKTAPTPPMPAVAHEVLDAAVPPDAASPDAQRAFAPLDAALRKPALAPSPEPTRPKAQGARKRERPVAKPPTAKKRPKPSRDGELMDPTEDDSASHGSASQGSASPGKGTRAPGKGTRAPGNNDVMDPTF